MEDNLASDVKEAGSAGLETYQDPKNRFAFDYPTDWMKLNVTSEAADGIALLPVATDNLTCLSVEVVNLGVRVTGTDLRTLKEGFVVGLDQLVDSKLDSVQVMYEGSSLALAAHQTYSDGWGHRERFVWLLYHGTTMVRVVAQGSSDVEFKRWAPRFADVLKTCRMARKPAVGAAWLAEFNARGPMEPPADPRRFYLDQVLPGEAE